MNRQTAVEERCAAVADTLVPNYRNGSRAYSCAGHVAKMWQAAYDGAAAVLADPLPADVRRLVIAAREVTDCGTDEDETRELLDAVEAFSSRVPYEDQPDDMADASVPDRLARRMGAEFVARDATPPVEGLTCGEGEPAGAVLICDQTGGTMFTWWPVPQHQKQEADSIYGSHGGYRTVPLYAVSPKATVASQEQLESAFPLEIGRLHRGERRSDGERLCSHSHAVPAGHPLYWPQQISQYDDSDPLCLQHAIEQAVDDNGYCEKCTADDFSPKATASVREDQA
ncbi:hypothetical protein SAQ01S_15160 [Sphingomonas aquatilis NBRC 16722]|uniref:Uncharacterized protein n=1 Tax=Sphingomonas aquatilis TaxID=93063 RepID=A0AAW3TTK8_9SPHN|nr:hypothetical protein [Sphingomonas aquatilis]MBB3876436.1 hypothetical protein [Sphingomonas aquatilis]GEM71750.1 hypothetical protein SAQ01S_15160 [Sphingomonas aquatilis NBRC 16722]